MSFLTYWNLVWKWRSESTVEGYHQNQYGRGSNLLRDWQEWAFNPSCVGILLESVFNYRVLNHNIDFSPTWLVRTTRIGIETQSATLTAYIIGWL